MRKPSSETDRDKTFEDIDINDVWKKFKVILTKAIPDRLRFP